MTIKITPEVEQLVEGIYSDGKYASPSEVLTTALVLLQQREQLRKDLEVGAREIDNGQRLDADQVFADLKKRATELGEAAQ